MEKDLITVLLENGTTKDMELVLMYCDDRSKINYVLYKDLGETDKCYAARYVFNNGLFEIDPNLDQSELVMLQLLLNSSLRNGE